MEISIYDAIQQLLDCRMNKTQAHEKLQLLTAIVQAIHVSPKDLVGVLSRKVTL